MSESLIYAMSTKGEMKLEHFNEIFKIVYLPVVRIKEQAIDTDVRRQVIRLLDSLGYCEFDFNNRVVHMCPPCLALLPFYGLPKVILVGARTSDLITKIKNAVKKRRDKAIFSAVLSRSQNINIPVSINIEAVDTATIQEIAAETGISCAVERPAAWDLVNFSASLAEVKQSLQWQNRAALNWNHKIFSTRRLIFLNQEEEKLEHRLIVYKNPNTQQSQHWLWNGTNAAEVEREWGRYLVLSNTGLSVLLYDEDHCKLAVPVTVSLPCLLARALAMCTGLSPVLATTVKQIGNIPAKHPVQIYSGVPSVIANLIAEKVGQKITITSLENEEGEVIYD
jgi:hypothetical protein